MSDILCFKLLSPIPCSLKTGCSSPPRQRVVHAGATSTMAWDLTLPLPHGAQQQAGGGVDALHIAMAH